MSVKSIAVTVAIALFAIYLSNRVQFLKNIVG